MIKYESLSGKADPHRGGLDPGPLYGVDGLAVSPLDDLANTFKRGAQKTTEVEDQRFPTHPSHGRSASSRQGCGAPEGSRSTDG